MLEQTWVKENQEIGKDEVDNLLVRIRVLDKEIRALDEMKASLLEIEKTLWFNLGEEVGVRKNEKDLLKTEVANLRQNCDSLLYFVNAFRQK